MTITFQQSLEDIARLVKQFNTNRAAYLAPGFKEAQARQALIDPFFIALGWDVHNSEQAAPDYQFVLVEENQHTAGHQRAPDYTFRTGKHDRKFFAEAKKPGVALKSSADAGYQLRSYGWNARLPVSILTDFDEFAVYNCRRKPLPKDKPNIARLHYYTCDEYAERWREIWDVFSLQAVRAGAFDQFARSGQSERGASTVDADFLATIEGWRKALAQNIELRNQLHEDDLTDAVQRSIDRLVFLRIAEDREIEPYEQLAEIGKGDGIYKRLASLFRKADKKYNSGLFNFDADKRALRLEVDDRVLRAIIGDLYGAYNFRIMPVEILGNVYEQFLGKVIHVTAGGHAKVEEKPEVRKAGGVYYTPSYIVEYIVRNTVGKQVEGKSAKEVAKLRVLDMACGSGSFLLGAYQFLLDWHLRWYIEHEPQKQKNAVYDAGRGERAAGWRLTTEEKKRILLANIYGVDIDRQAVEVTKVSLLLKVLEDEKGEKGQLALLEQDGERVLPDLDKNILCGNSLIGPDYFEDSLMPAAEEMKRVNPFDWQSAFPEIMRAGGFDCVIGNPPYVRSVTLKSSDPVLWDLYRSCYLAASTREWDIYMLFVEKALLLLSKDGLLGFILPNKFLNSQVGVNLRGILSKGQNLSRLVHFGAFQVFENATTYTCLLFLNSSPQESAAVSRYTGDVTNGSNRCPLPEEQPLVWKTEQVLARTLSAEVWEFAASGGKVLQKIRQFPTLETMAQIFQGTGTRADKVFLLEYKETVGNKIRVYSAEAEKDFLLDHAYLKPALRGRSIGRYRVNDHKWLLLVPYRQVNGRYKLVQEKELASSAPHTLEYLRTCKARLDERENGRFKEPGWFCFGRPQNLDRFEIPEKIVLPDVANQGTCYLDREGMWLLDTAYAIVLKAGIQHDLRYLLALLNSPLLTYYLRETGTALRGGYFRMKTAYLNPFPIRPIDFSDPADKARHDRMVALVERMLELHKRLHNAGSDSEREVLQRQIEATDRQIDALVYELYGLSEAEVAVVEG